MRREPCGNYANKHIRKEISRSLLRRVLATIVVLPLPILPLRSSRSETVFSRERDPAFPSLFLTSIKSAGGVRSTRTAQISSRSYSSVTTRTIEWSRVLRHTVLTLLCLQDFLCLAYWTCSGPWSPVAFALFPRLVINKKPGIVVFMPFSDIDHREKDIGSKSVAANKTSRF